MRLISENFNNFYFFSVFLFRFARMSISFLGDKIALFKFVEYEDG